MRKATIFKSALVALVALAIGVLQPCSSIVSAADIPAERIQLSTLSIRPELNPGETYTSHMTVHNTGTDSFKFKVAATAYGVQGDDYVDVFDQANDNTNIVNWISFNQTEYTLESNGSIDVPFTIKVPSDVAAGGQYAAITAEIVHDDSTNGNAGIQSQYRLAMPIYAQINGNTRKTGEVINNDISGVFINSPISASSLVSNTGNTHADETITFEVNNLFGGDEVYSNSSNPEKHILLPNTRRYVAVKWDDTPQLGIFKVKQSVEFLGKTSTVEKVVLVCPIWLIIVLCILIAALIIWIIFRVKGRKANRKGKE